MFADQHASVVADWLEDELERLEHEHAAEDAAAHKAWGDQLTYTNGRARRQGHREAYAVLAKTLREINQ